MSSDLLAGLADVFEPPEQAFFDDPVAWVREFVDFGDGRSLFPYQEEALRTLVADRRVAIRGPHSLGKTAVSALTVLWFALTREGKDWKVVTTATSWLQLTMYTWPEIHKWARMLRWDRLGRKPFSPVELRTLALKLGTGVAFACSPEDHVRLEGAHADHLLYVFDEAKGIKAEIWDAAEGALAGGDAMALAISTPGEPQGRFFQIHKREPGYEDWTAQRVTLEQAIASGQIRREWAEQRKRQWGGESAIYLNRVEGEFASSDEDGVIPLSWVEAAQERWLDAHPGCGVVRSGEPLGYRHSCSLPDFTCVGCDPARSGPDVTVLALRHGTEITELRRTSKEGTTQTSGRVKGVLEQRGGGAVVDVIGIGAGVVDQLRDLPHLRKKVLAFNSSEKTPRKDRTGELGFVNTRSAAWWHLREMLDPDSPDEPILLPPDDELTGDLTAPKWWVTSAGKIQIEGKDDIRKRLSRSTDVGDAVVMAFWFDAAKRKSLVVSPFGQSSRSYWRQAG